MADPVLRSLPDVRDAARGEAGGVIEVHGLQKSYGTTRAVEDVSFSVAEGEILGILGPNGAGKTTTVECVAGLRRGDAGSVRVAGLDPWTERDAVTRVLGVQLQDSQLQPKLTVREALELWTSFYDDPQPWPELVERLGLGDRQDTRFAALSGGQQQRLAIALALVGRPRAVVLDELTTGLDPRARREVWDLVRDLRADGVTVLLVTHAMEEAQALCDRVAIVAGGRVRALDTPDALMSGGASTTISFETGADVDEALLARLPGVTGVRREGARLVVEGGEDTAPGRARHRSAPAGHTPTRLRVAARSLDETYLEMTA